VKSTAREQPGLGMNVAWLLAYVHNTVSSVQYIVTREFLFGTCPDQNCASILGRCLLSLALRQHAYTYSISLRLTRDS